MPSVESSVLRISPRRPFPFSEAQEDDLRELTRTTFGWRRKQLQRILRNAAAYQLDSTELESLQTRTGFDLTRRIETFEPAQIVQLVDHLRALGRPHSDPAVR